MNALVCLVPPHTASHSQAQHGEQGPTPWYVLSQPIGFESCMTRVRTCIGPALESDVIHAAAWAEGETEAKLALALLEEVCLAPP